MARPIAAWLVARPQNTVLGLLASLALPPRLILGTAVMTFLLLYDNNLRRVALLALFAAALMTVLDTLLGGSPAVVIRLAATAWIPAAALGLLLRHSRSLTLTIQVSAIVTLVFTLAFFFTQGDVNEFGRALVVRIADAMREVGFTEQADALMQQQATAAWQLTTFVVLAQWSSFALGVGAGMALFRNMQEDPARISGFSSLNLGRVLAITVVVACVAALASGAVWLQSFAFVAFTMFWLQGLAILHWLQQRGTLPMAVLVAVYIALPVLNLLPLLALALAGYFDAWFDFRKRLQMNSASG